jgi:hypothetical protein
MLIGEGKDAKNYQYPQLIHFRSERHQICDRTLPRIWQKFLNYWQYTSSPLRWPHRPKKNVERELNVLSKDAIVIHMPKKVHSARQN